MAIYRGPGGSGDATTDSSSQAIGATNAAAAALVSQNAAATSATASQASAVNSATSATGAASSASIGLPKISPSICLGKLTVVSAHKIGAQAN